MNGSQELVKYLAEKVSALSADLQQPRTKDRLWYFARTVTKILIIQTQCLVTIIKEKNHASLSSE
jgi:hypothetical protein